MVCWSLVAPAPVLGDLGLGEEEIFMSVRSFFIVWYYVEVAATSRALAYVSCDSVSHVSGHIFLAGAAAVLVAYSPAVGGAEPSNDPAIFHR